MRRYLAHVAPPKPPPTTTTRGAAFAAFGADAQPLSPSADSALPAPIHLTKSLREMLAMLFPLLLQTAEIVRDFDDFLVGVAAGVPPHDRRGALPRAEASQFKNS